MKVLVAVRHYSKPNEKSSHFFIQVRNIYYKKYGLDIDVLNFTAREDYIVDGINVYTLNTYKKVLVAKQYDLLICHQPDIRIKTHYFFLRKYGTNFPKFMFVFHGQEVLRVNKVYPEPYFYMKHSSFFMKWFRDIYDSLKFILWRRYYSKVAHKSRFVFVSKWMYDEFLKWIKIPSKLLENRCSIIYNCIGNLFETGNYDVSQNKEYDFITIRGFLDYPKYCIDVVNQLAINNPHFKFLIIGKGKFFNYIEKAPNVTWLDIHLDHGKIIEFLNRSRCALMPTKTDAQGLMMCEMASFGIPVITSNIPVCIEVLFNFDNVKLIDNNQVEVDLTQCLSELEYGLPYEKNQKYFSHNTTMKEIELIKSIINPTK
jgi:glycosyltransferase involved in cell wall biosynthesis